MPHDPESALTPKLRLQAFQNTPGWEAKPGDELFDQINNREAPAGLPILAITQEHGAIPREDINYHVSVTDKSVETYKEVCPGDFIISLRSFQGGIEYSNYHGICSPAYVILRKKTELSDAFFKQLFKSYSFIQQLTKNLEGLRDGKMISYKQFSELLLPWPKPAEQQKIAECLSSLDELIRVENQKLDALNAHKKGLMQELFPGEGETLPRLRFPEFQSAPEWVRRPLGELVQFQSGFAFSSSHFGTEGMKLVTPKNFTSSGFGRFDGSNTKFTTELVPSKYLCRPGDLLLLLTDLTPTCELLGKPLELSVSDGAVWLNQRIVRVEPMSTEVSRAFLKQFFLTDYYSGIIRKTASGSTVRHSSNKVLENSGLMFPTSADEQHCIATCLSSLDDLIAAQSDRLSTLQTHKQGLMQQLFPSPVEAEV